jgi:hypothetical protein
MTASEYRDELTNLNDTQRKELSEEIHLGGQTDVDTMVRIFEKYRQSHRVEEKAVWWLNRYVPGSRAKTQADRESEALIAFAEHAKRAAASPTTIVQNINGAQVVAGHSIHGGVVVVNMTFVEVLQAAERQIQENSEISEEEKKTLIDKLKDLASNSYLANLATSAIWDGAKLLWTLGQQG